MLVRRIAPLFAAAPLLAGCAAEEPAASPDPPPPVTTPSAPDDSAADEDDGARSDDTSADGQEGSTGGAEATSAVADVAIAEDGGFAFAPAELEVVVGDTVRWVHEGEAPHTVTGGGLNSGPMASGDSYEVTFDEPGEFAYACYFHPEMRGTVTVG